jgi:Asp-tRNA(Asn)/Glu-tRNA(Gln) amidotransferase A subunit family amidase
MQIIGGKFRDGELLSFAYYFEKEGLCDLDEVKGGVQL